MFTAQAVPLKVAAGEQLDSCVIGIAHMIIANYGYTTG